jgi:hypothetical protein
MVVFRSFMEGMNLLAWAYQSFGATVGSDGIGDRERLIFQRTIIGD